MIEEETLARLIRLRRYEELDTIIDQLLREQEWSEILTQLQSIPEPSIHYYPEEHYYSSRMAILEKLTGPYYITEQILDGRPWLFSSENAGWGVRRGTLRNGIIHVLGLPIVQGIDLGSLQPFEGMQASSLDELRQSAIPIALDVLGHRQRRI